MRKLPIAARSIEMKIARKKTMRRLPTTPTLATAISWSGPRRSWAWVASAWRIVSIWADTSTWSKPSVRSQSVIGWISATRSRWNVGRFPMNSVVDVMSADAARRTSPKAAIATEP
jgi:hypothetical protein